MQNNLPMTIHTGRGKDNFPGYVYLAKLNWFKNCFKIGSTGNIFSRMDNLRCSHVEVELIAYGYTIHRLIVENKIQELLYEYSNIGKFNAFLKKRKYDIDYQYCGDIGSTEYFIFDTVQVCDALILFDFLCNSVGIGTTHPLYKTKPERKSLGYGECAQKYWDSGQRKYVPYATKFVNNRPKFLPYEEWENVPYIGIDRKIIHDGGIAHKLPADL